MLCREVHVVMKKRNPVIQKAYEQGRTEGFALGEDMGELKGIAKTTSFFRVKFLELEKTPGIGPKTLDRIRKAIGEKYFEAGERNGS